MWRNSRPSFRRLAVAALVLGEGAAVLIFVLAAVNGSKAADDYGRIAVPGKGTLELPAGKVALYYEERITINRNDAALDPPDGLRVAARREERVVSENKGVPNAINLDGRSMVEFAELDVPAEGRYRVAVRSAEAGSNRPAVAFGKGLGTAMLDGLKLAGIASVGGIVLALLLLLAGRIGYTAEPRIRPVAAAAPAAPWQPPPAPEPTDHGGGLRELERLRAQGLVSDEEYEARRRDLLQSL